MSAVSSAVELVDAVRDDRTTVGSKKTRDDLDKISVRVSVINIGLNVHGLTGVVTKAEVVERVLSTVEEAIDIWNAVEDEEKAQGNPEMECIFRNFRNDGNDGSGGHGGHH